jgi:hypothetical protein
MVNKYIIVSPGSPNWSAWLDKHTSLRMFVWSALSLWYETEFLICFKILTGRFRQIPVAERPKARFCGHWVSGIATVNVAEGHGYLSVVSVTCCQVEISATGRSVVRRIPTNYGVLSLIWKRQKWGGPGQRWAVAPEEKKSRNTARNPGSSCVQFLGAFANLRKAIIRSVISICPSVCPHGTTLLPLDGFWWNLIFEL